MYPYFRMMKEVWAFRAAPRLPILGGHVSSHRIWPVDLDPWRELNNGRTLTLFDLGRIPLFLRNGLAGVARRNGWGITVAGNSLRYRKRVVLFQKLSMVSRVVGWDDRFFYIEQSFWSGENCTSHMLLRAAFVGKAGIVPTQTVIEALDPSLVSPPLAEWIKGWIAADAERPWPPAREA